jgi:hypothetical protein
VRRPAPSRRANCATAAHGMPARESPPRSRPPTARLPVPCAESMRASRNS